MHARCFVVVSCRPGYHFYGVHVRLVVELPRDTEGVAQVGRPDKEHVYAVHRSDLSRVLETFFGFDLSDPDQRSADGIYIGVLRQSVPGPARAQSDSAHSERWVTEKPGQLCGGLRAIDLRNHDSLGAKVEHPPNPQPRQRLNPDHRWRSDCGQGLELGKEIALRPAAMLEVDQSPVEPGSGHNLGRHRRPELQERAEQ